MVQVFCSRSWMKVEKSDKTRVSASIVEKTAVLLSHPFLTRDHLLVGSDAVSSDSNSFPLTNTEDDEVDVIGSDADVSDTLSSDDDSDSVDDRNSSKRSKRKDEELLNYNKKRVLSIIKEVAMSNASEDLEEQEAEADAEDHDNESYLSYDISAEFSEEETIEMIL